MLRERCADDESLHEEVLALLETADEDETTSDNATTAAAGAHAADTEPSPIFPKSIGRYEIKGIVDSGGMGIVYEAMQEHPHRRVALKVIRPGVTSAEALARFEHESHILGKLQHAGIAQIFEAGMFNAGNGRQPFFAMEFIRGESLTQFADNHKLGTRQRIELVAKVCEAVQHAHHRGVIHRDLKPRNILIDESGQPKILDFGVARATDSDVQTTTLRTDMGQLIGTVPYMSPEQAAGDVDEVDMRSDVYALGVISYELLAGRLPYDLSRKMVHEAVRIIREHEPTRLSSINRVFRGDVETIVGKALEKNRTRRYQSASELGSDIWRYLHDQPIVARPPKLGYQLSKFAKRHKALVVGVATVFVVLVLGILGTSWGMMRAIASEQEEAKQRQIAEVVNDFVINDMLGAANPNKTPDREMTVREAVDAASARIAGRFVDEPLVEASIRTTLAEVYWTLSRYDLAEPHVRAALEIRRRVLGDRHYESLASMGNLATIYDELGRHDEATALYEQSLELKRSALGEDDQSTLLTMSNLALAYEIQGRYEEAESLYADVIEGRRRLLGENHRETLISLGNLGVLYLNQGRYDEAESLLTETTDRRRRVLGEDDPDTLRAINSLGAVYNKQGKYAKAEPLYVDALNIKRRVLGESHHSTLISMANLGGMYCELERHDEAYELLGSAVERARQTLPVGHWHTGEFLLKLGTSLKGLQRYEEAEDALLEAHQIIEAALGRTSDRTVKAVDALIDFYESWGRPEEAEGWRSRLSVSGEPSAENRDSGTDD
ncbi:MAG: serine/threonine protein kinase [Planctomycetota bacterium]